MFAVCMLVEASSPQTSKKIMDKKHIYNRTWSGKMHELRAGKQTLDVKKAQAPRMTHYIYIYIYIYISI